MGGGGERLSQLRRMHKRDMLQRREGGRECVMWVLVAEGSVSVSNNNYLLLQLCVHPRSCTFGHYHTWNVQRLPA